MARTQQVRNVERDPRVVLSFDAPRTPGVFLAEHAVLRARAIVEPGGAWELLDRLGRVYVAPDFEFPGAGGDPAAGFVLRYTIDRVSGAGPWAPDPAH